MIIKKAIEAQKPPGKVMTPEEVKAMMIQLQKNAALPSLLYVTRKLGEVEGIVKMQADPDMALVHIQDDLRQLYDKLVEDAGIELVQESFHCGIGGDI